MCPKTADNGVVVCCPCDWCYCRGMCLPCNFCETPTPTVPPTYPPTYTPYPTPYPTPPPTYQTPTPTGCDGEVIFIWQCYNSEAGHDCINAPGGKCPGYYEYVLGSCTDNCHPDMTNANGERVCGTPFYAPCVP